MGNLVCSISINKNEYRLTLGVRVALVMALRHKAYGLIATIHATLALSLTSKRRMVPQPPHLLVVPVAAS